jgi:hypothetical protein
MPEEHRKKESKVAIVLSILALSISAFAFYLDHFYNVHQLQAALVSCEFGNGDPDFNTKADIVAINGGKQTEVVLSAILTLTEAGAAFPYKEFHQYGPFILKAGEAKTIKFDESWPPTDLHKPNTRSWKDPSQPYDDLVIEFVAVDSEGRRVITKAILWRLTFASNGQFADAEEGAWARNKLIFTSLLHK